MSELVPLKSYYNKHDAQMAQGLLVEAGIESILQADDCGGYRPHLTLGTGNNRLLVKPEDLDRAKDVIKVLDEPIEG